MLTADPLRHGLRRATSLPLLAFGHFPLTGGIGPRKGGGFIHQMYAMVSTSTSTSLGRRPTSTAERAGQFSV